MSRFIIIALVIHVNIGQSQSIESLIEKKIFFGYTVGKSINNNSGAFVFKKENDYYPSNPIESKYYPYAQNDHSESFSMRPLKYNGEFYKSLVYNFYVKCLYDSTIYSTIIEFYDLKDLNEVANKLNTDYNIKLVQKKDFFVYLTDRYFLELTKNSFEIRDINFYPDSIISRLKKLKIRQDKICIAKYNLRNKKRKLPYNKGSINLSPLALFSYLKTKPSLSNLENSLPTDWKLSEVDSTFNKDSRDIDYISLKYEFLYVKNPVEMEIIYYPSLKRFFNISYTIYKSIDWMNVKGNLQKNGFRVIDIQNQAYGKLYVFKRSKEEFVEFFNYHSSIKSNISAGKVLYGPNFSYWGR